jgi:CDP-diglyceride synthetase
MTWKRVATALVLIPIVVAIVLFTNTAVVAMTTSIITVLALWEYFALGDAIGHRAYRLWTTFCALLLIYFQFLNAYDSRVSQPIHFLFGWPIGEPPSLQWVVFLFVLGLTMFTLWTKRALVEALPATGISSSALLLTAFPLSYAVPLHGLPRIGPRLLLFALAITWAADTTAYFIGRAIGKHPLAPHISPKKTWEGSIGSMVGSLLVAYAFSFWILVPLPHLLIMAATGDRVPCVFVENRRVVNLDPNDPIRVNYDLPFPGEPTGAAHPELLKLHPSHGHDNSIVNGISRIGYMTGGKSALWVDENIADVLTAKATRFIDTHKASPFFLYFATHDIHVPRVPNPRFTGKTGMGPRGDAIAELDWSVGQVLASLERNGLARDTIVMFTSDNGPVVDDGYQDQAVEKLGSHKPAGPLRGGKYSKFDGGTRVPMLARWPGHIKPDSVSSALISQVDLCASLAALTEQKLPADAAPDSVNVLPALLGQSKTARQSLVEHAGTLALVEGDWKLIAPGNGPRMNENTHTETGNDPEPQLYNLAKDLGETTNLASQFPERVISMTALLNEIRSKGRL